MMTRAPSCAKRTAIPCPMPELDPVTTAIRSFRRAMHPPLEMSAMSDAAARSMPRQRFTDYDASVTLQTLEGRQDIGSTRRDCALCRGTDDGAEKISAATGPPHHDQHEA